MPASESVIRRMTRLANEHGAINLAQGFTDEPPAFPLVWGAIAALLGGSDEGMAAARSGVHGGSGRTRPDGHGCVAAGR